MRTPSFSALRRRGVLIASGTAIVLAAGGGATAAFAAGTDSTPAPTTSAATCAPHLRALLVGGTSTALKADLKALRAEKRGERADERAAIRAKALAGGYGARVERVAAIAAGETAKGRHWYASLPAALQADLKTLRATAAKSDARRAEARTIAAKALDGGYGTTVQQHAKAAQERIQQRCAAQR